MRRTPPPKNNVEQAIAAFNAVVQVPAIRIRRCSNPAYWYASKVGRMVVISHVDVDGVWAFEDDGHMNVIAHGDVI